MTTIFEEAEEIVQGARQKFYGAPDENHGRTAIMWSAYLDRTVTAEDVCMLNILQKVSRGRHSLTRDTLVDIAGYARNIEIIQEAKTDGK